MSRVRTFFLNSGMLWLTVLLIWSWILMEGGCLRQLSWANEPWGSDDAVERKKERERERVGENGGEYQFERGGTIPLFHYNINKYRQNTTKHNKKFTRMFQHAANSHVLGTACQIISHVLFIINPVMFNFFLFHFFNIPPTKAPKEHATKFS